MQTTESSSEPSFHRVLLATDFSAASQAAFQTALGICSALGASLLILHVFEYADAVPPEAGGRLLELDSVYKEACNSLHELARMGQAAGVTCETTICNGVAALTILDKIASEQIDLAILGTNAPHGFERLVFGSTAEAVLRRAPCPVLTVGPRVLDAAKAAQLEGPVIFATDFHLVTTHAIRYAASFCKATRSPLYCLHVLPRTLEGGPRSHIIPQIMTEALQQVATVSGAAIDPPVCAVTYGSEVSNAVVDYARQQNAKMIVLGVRQTSMLTSHIAAHIAYRIITEAPCPVLTMAFASQSHHTALEAACL